MTPADRAAARHVPVLLEDTLELLQPALASGGWVVDATTGLGGHSEAMLKAFPEVKLVAVDRDPEAMKLAQERLAPFSRRIFWVCSRFAEIEQRLPGLGIERVHAVLADLGVSSMQLDVASRGFSFQQDGPLDMRMAGTGDLVEVESGSIGNGSPSETGSPADIESGPGSLPEMTAAEIVNSYPEEELAMIFKEYGEERQAKRIARGIVEARREKPFETTGELARLVERLKPRQWSRPRSRGGRGGRGRAGQKTVHPATQVFQALRIEVNQELEELKELLDESVRLLEQDGRLVVISYHSLEDRIVKHTLRDLATGEIEPITGRPRAETQVIEVLTKKPVRPSEREIAVNPRSRSARLRAARRL